VEVRRKAEAEEAEAAADTEMTDIETVARIGDRSLLAEKLEAEEGEEQEAVTSLISTFQLEANGRVEKVIRIESKKGQPVLLIQFDSAEFRDEVLKSSRRPGARSSTSVRFRRPKVKDLKHVVTPGQEALGAAAARHPQQVTSPRCRVGPSQPRHKNIPILILTAHTMFPHFFSSP